MTVLDNVIFPLRMRGVIKDEAEERARSALELVQLPPQTHQVLPSQLSGGQKQRVAVARAIVFNPLVLLMDEPLAALDRRLRQDMQFELRHLQSKIGTTVIYVTHDQEEALVLADRVAVMREGRFEQVGSPKEIYDTPANAFVAGFLGESNKLRVVVKKRIDNEAIVSPEGQKNIELRVKLGQLNVDEALFIVRPEDVNIRRDIPEENLEVSLLARISDVAFLGSYMRVELIVIEEETWTASLHPRQVDKELSWLRPGEEVFVTWAKKDGRLVSL
jgi:ABC-type Fe3+/spermidine/putrescine transport system ATPase subunit